MIQVKTSAKCAGCVAKIAEQLNTFLTPEQWSIDLSSPDKLLTVKADVSAEKVDRGCACPPGLRPNYCKGTVQTSTKSSYMRYQTV